MKAMNEKGAAAATHRPPILSFKFFSLNRISILVLVILFGFASASYAAEDEKNKQIEELTSI